MKQKILIFGESGLVGSRFTQLFGKVFDILAPTIDQVDVLDEGNLFSCVDASGAEIVINLAAYTDVDGAEKEVGEKQGLVYKLNALVPANLAKICKDRNKLLIHFSTSYVFDGTSGVPYKEEDRENPLGWYAKTKHFADVAIEESGCNFAIIRIDIPYRAHYELKKDLARFFLDKLQRGEKITAVQNQKITPAFIDDIANALKKIIETKTAGVFHIGSTDTTSPYDFAKLIAVEFGLDEGLVDEIPFVDYHKTRLAPRSQNSWMDVSKFVRSFGEGILHTNEENIKTFKKQTDPLTNGL